MLNRKARYGFQTRNPILHSIAWPNTGLGKELKQSYFNNQIDIVNLHWLGDYTISIEEIGSLRMPMIWSLHDQWAFCGAEHYSNLILPSEASNSDERFTAGYSPASRPVHDSGPDLNRRTWLRKHRAWRRPIHIVCSSNWLADCVRRSTLMGNWPVSVIPCPIDLNVWAPLSKIQARAILGLPSDRPLVLFGAIGGSCDPRKGAHLLLEALQRLRIQVANSPLEQLELMIFGQSRPAQPPELGFPIHYSGHLHDDLSLRLHYTAADVMVVPSLQEAFGQTASEAHACGTPVVAFKTGGLVDIVDPHITGALAQPFDPLSLASAIRWVLEDSQRNHQLGLAARRRAELLWDSARVAGLYGNVYNIVLDNHSMTDPDDLPGAIKLKA
jgi:glycosyltransferase involved in cell wall biosynthesis